MDHPQILLGHGGGGRLTGRLFEQVFLPAFRNPHLETRHDGAELRIGNSRLAFTTDSFVVRPLLFPGGDIGTLAVNGTVNDLAMCGARPLYLSAGFILEEGFPIETLRTIAESMRRACERAGVQIVTGDTKVVEHGKGDGLYINTSGIGVIEHDLPIGPRQVREGDLVLLNGDIGRHGIAVLASREGLEFESSIESDCAPLNGAVAELLKAGIEVHCLRDLTRGGLATAMAEIASAAKADIELEESAIAVRPEVRGACEILGLDPLYVANEGRFVAFVAPSHADRSLACLRDGAIIGRVADSRRGRVTVRTGIGSRRILDLLSGEQLPRIC